MEEAHSVMMNSPSSPFPQAATAAKHRIAFVTSDDPVPPDVVSDGFLVDVVRSSADVIPYDATAVLLNELSALDGALRAQELGYDGVLVPDYGLHAARSALSIPVVGTNHAGMHLAASLGRRIGIVTVWPDFVAPLYSRRVDELGLTDRFVGVRHVASDDEMGTLADDDGFYQQTKLGVGGVIDRIVAETRALVAEDGADVVVFGCNCMRNVAPAVAHRVDVPIVEPVRAGYALLELLLNLDLRHSRRAYAPMKIDRTRLVGELVKAAEVGLAAEEAEFCGICSIASGDCSTPHSRG